MGSTFLWAVNCFIREIIPNRLHSVCTCTLLLLLLLLLLIYLINLQFQCHCLYYSSDAMKVAGGMIHGQAEADPNASIGERVAIAAGKYI